MVTTIAVKESTVQLLTRLKEKIKANSLDETIIRLVRKVENTPVSRFGSQPNLKKFSEKERSYYHEL